MKHPHLSAGLLRPALPSLVFLLAFFLLHSSFAAPAPQDEVAKQKAAELAELVRANGEACNQLIRKMADCGRKKDYDGVTNCHAQIVALLALKEGAPVNVSPYRLHMETARALSENLHLRWASLAARHFAEAEKAASTPREKAEALFRAASLEYDVAAGDDIAPLVAKVRSALALSGLSKSDLLDLVFRYPTKIDPDFDVAAEAWKIAEGEPALHGRDYTGVLPSKPRGQNDTLNPAQSTERVLEICRKAIADPAVGDRDRGRFVDREIDALLDLGRAAEVEKLLVDRASTTNQRPRATWNKRLGDFYVEQARRYYLPAHEPTVRKALAAYREACLASPADGRPVEAIYTAAMSIRDYDAAEKAVVRRIEQSKGETNFWAWCQLGRIAHAREDYAAAAAAFGAVEGNLDRLCRRRYAESLHALGRIEETIAQLEKLEKEDYRSVKDSDRYYIQYLKKRLEEEKAK